MRDRVLWRKQARIILALAAALAIDEERALDLFYSTETYRQLSDPKCGLQLMSDGYIVEMCFPNCVTSRSIRPVCPL